MRPSTPAAAYDALPIQVWTARPDGTLDYANPAVTGYFCVDAARILEHGWKDLCHPLDLIQASERWAQSLRTGEPYELAFRLLRGVDHRYRWHVARATAVRDGDGAITHWVGTNTEVDHIKRAEEVAGATLGRLQRDHGRWQALFAQLPAAIIVTAGERHLIDLCSDAARALTDMGIGGQTFAAAFPAIAAALGSTPLDAAYHRGEATIVRDVPLAHSLRGAGLPDRVDLNCVPVRRSGDEIDGVVVVVTAIGPM